MAINNNDYSGQMNWGDWQQMPDHRQFGPARNSSPVASLGRMLDPMTYIPGLNWLPNKVHDAGEAVAQKSNQALEPAFKVLGTVGEHTDPFQMTLKKAMPERHAGVRDWITEHPVDTMALVAASFFGGAALGGAAGGAGGAAGAPAASAAGGTGGLSGFGAAGSTAITPSFAGGAVAPAATGGAGLVGASSISPALASGAYLGGAGAAGSGTLGAVGTKAALSAITPTFQSGLAGGSGGGLLSSAEKALGYLKQGNTYRSNIESFVDADKRSRTRAPDNIGERILNSYRQDTTPTRKLARSITMQRFRR